MIDSDEKVEQLIRDYFFQLTVGCDVIDCQEEECLSSPFFKHNFQTKTDAAVRAVELSLNHAFWPHLCNGPNYYMINPEIHNETKRFDSLVSKIINNCTSYKYPQSTRSLKNNNNFCRSQNKYVNRLKGVKLLLEILKKKKNICVYAYVTYHTPFI